MKAATEWKEFEDLLNAKPVGEVVPKNFKTVRQIAKQFNLSVQHAGSIVAAKVQEGKLEMKKFRVDVGGKLYPTPHYAPKSK